MTDADVVLGRLPADRAARRAASASTPARRARRRGRPGRASSGLGLEECAEGIVTVAVQEMVRALRLVSVERGEDPREATLIAFGGAGPLHACPVADELGVRRVVAPPAAGVLAALGLVIAGERRDYVQTVLAPVDGGRGPRRASSRPLRERARGARSRARAQTAAADCRYAGQSHSLTVAWDPDAPESALAEAFHAAHRERFGDADPGRAGRGRHACAWRPSARARTRSIAPADPGDDGGRPGRDPDGRRHLLGRPRAGPPARDAGRRDRDGARVTPRSRSPSR